jgi:hypothetical protein
LSVIFEVSLGRSFVAALGGLQSCSADPSIPVMRLIYGRNYTLCHLLT